jgi:CheY-like chemotaxis protein
MPKPPVLVVDDDPITAGLFEEVVTLDGYACRREVDLRTAIAFLSECEKPHIVTIRYVMPQLFREYDWYAQLVKIPQLQRHAYIEAWHCYDAPEDEPHRPIQKRFKIQQLPCTSDVRIFLDALDKATEDACLRLMKSAQM